VVHSRRLTSSVNTTGILFLFRFRVHRAKTRGNVWHREPPSLRRNTSIVISVPNIRLCWRLQVNFRRWRRRHNRRIISSGIYNGLVLAYTLANRWSIFHLLVISSRRWKIWNAELCSSELSKYVLHHFPFRQYPVLRIAFCRICHIYIIYNKHNWWSIFLYTVRTMFGLRMTIYISLIIDNSVIFSHSNNIFVDS